MRIALTSLYLPSCSKIGVGYQVHYLANALTERGHNVTVFSPCPRPEGGKYLVSVVPSRGKLATFRFAWDLRSVDFDRFDVLNAHGDDWFLWGVRRPRHIHTYHGSCFSEMFHVHGLKEKLRMALLAGCETQAGLLANETVAVSENSKKYIPGIGHVIPCGVHLKEFFPAAQKSDCPSILFVGTMHGRKRGRMLLAAFINEIQPEVDGVELWCVCERPDDLAEQKGVRWFGRLSAEELAELYRSAWVFCLPSAYEGFGVPYIEAMASGTPVVATANPGALEVTESGRFGHISQDEAIGSSLIGLLRNDAERQGMAERGLVRAQDFSWNTICERYENLYRNTQSKGVSN